MGRPRKTTTTNTTTIDQPTHSMEQLVAETARVKELQDLVLQHATALDRAKTLYEDADRALARIKELIQPGEKIDLGEGRTLQLVDKFADKDRAFKTCVIQRYDLKISRR